MSLDKRRDINAVEDDYIKKLVSLAGVMKKNGHLPEAAKAYEEAAALLKAQNGESGEYGKLILRAAKAEAELLNISKAEKLFDEAQKIILSIFGDDSDVYLAVCYDITVFYVKSGNAKKAVKMLAFLNKKADELENCLFNQEKYKQRLIRLREKIQKM